MGLRKNAATKPLLFRSDYVSDFFNVQRPRRSLLVISVVALLMMIVNSMYEYRQNQYGLHIPSSDSIEKSTKHDIPQNNLHVLMTAQKQDVNLCKTMLGLSLFDYPAPTVIAWESSFHWPLLGGGSHLAKITLVLEHLKSLLDTGSEASDLVFMLDALDIWVQLPWQVLVQRYHSITEAENKRIYQRMGQAAAKEGVKQTIVFGAGKRCAPNDLFSVACFAIPDSPLPHDLYGGDTDTLVGFNEAASFRQRYLNSGYVIGPLGDMYRIFEAAQRRLNLCMTYSSKNPSPSDDGNHEPVYCYHGSDQSIFAELFGEQEFHREIMRRHHHTWRDSVLEFFSPNRPGSPRPNALLGGALVDDVLDPSFTHESMNATYQPGKPHDFGIGLDYFSDLGHQTVNSEEPEDAQYLFYNESISGQMRPRSKVACPLNSRLALSTDHDPAAALPKDIWTWPLPGVDGPSGPTSIRLYTHLCLGVVPVMIHHNGDKEERERDWDKVWYQKQLPAMLNAGVRSSDTPWMRREPGIWVVEAGKEEFPWVQAGKNKKFLPWVDACPAEYDQELYGEEFERGKTPMPEGY
ncbi:hypothetical protein PV11_02263 [Exophiala sideris]|uniref:Uncharacterized protein n=1 Tax=Exophiala sideris TaxID=1016849 RepID=A0A0D1XF08_9EURO|nr:hypothetical protein PV11_02263 [Exophiala sideris]